MNSIVVPDHMDRWSRNQRLYETLKGMGLYVSPIPEANDPTRIKEMIVAADLPVQETAEQTAQASVVLAVQGPQVADVVGAAEGAGMNVVLFPAIR